MQVESQEAPKLNEWLEQIEITLDKQTIRANIKAEGTYRSIQYKQPPIVATDHAFPDAHQNAESDDSWVYSSDLYIYNDRYFIDIQVHTKVSVFFS